VAGERSVAELLQDVVRHLQEIVRSEVRLAKTEITEDAKRGLSAGAWIGAGAFFAATAWVFLLWTAAYGLATVMPLWGAALIITLVMAVLAGGFVMSGVRRVKHVHPVPERTIASVKENIEWLKPSTK
jgi:uncharacterized membrane protein YqjE